MTVRAVFDSAGRRRSPAILPGYHAGRPPRNKDERYPESLRRASEPSSSAITDERQASDARARPRLLQSECGDVASTAGAIDWGREG